eukprot:UN13876
MDYAVVEYAYNGVAFYNGSTGTVRNSTLSNNSYGVHIHGDTSPVIEGNTFTNNAYDGVNIVGKTGQSPGTSQILNNTIINNGRYGVYVHGVINTPGSDPLPVVAGT